MTICDNKNQTRIQQNEVGKKQRLKLLFNSVLRYLLMHYKHKYWPSVPVLRSMKQWCVMHIGCHAFYMFFYRSTR